MAHNLQRRGYGGGSASQEPPAALLAEAERIVASLAAPGRSTLSLEEFAVAEMMFRAQVLVPGSAMHSNEDGDGDVDEDDDDVDDEDDDNADYDDDEEEEEEHAGDDDEEEEEEDDGDDGGDPSLSMAYYSRGEAGGGGTTGDFNLPFHVMSIVPLIYGCAPVRPRRKAGTAGHRPHLGFSTSTATAAFPLRTSNK